MLIWPSSIYQSGTTSVLEAFRVLVSSGFQPVHHPVEFHWNSAEEGGLLGSKAIAQDYQAKGIKVKCYQQIDMSAWVKQGTEPTIGLIRDFVDPEFTDYLAKVIDEYCELSLYRVATYKSRRESRDWPELRYLATIGWTSTKCGTSWLFQTSHDVADAFATHRLCVQWSCVVVCSGSSFCIHHRIDFRRFQPQHPQRQGHDWILEGVLFRTHGRGKLFSSIFTDRTTDPSRRNSSLVSLLASLLNSQVEILSSRLELPDSSQIFAYIHFPLLFMICLPSSLSLSRTVANEHILTHDAIGAEPADPFLLFPLFSSLPTSILVKAVKAMPLFSRSSSNTPIPLLNSASPWASTKEDLQQLWDCPHTQAITTRTATLDGYPDDPKKHQVRRLSLSCCWWSLSFLEKVAFFGSKSSINSYGFSPYPLEKYLEWLKEIVKKDPRKKRLIFSIGASGEEELERIFPMLERFAKDLGIKLGVEFNASCPNLNGEHRVFNLRDSQKLIFFASLASTTS